MKQILCTIIILLGFKFNAQTTGTLTFSFTPTSHVGYDGTKNVLAVWIQDASGGFVKTKVRNVGWNTSDHLPTWAVNAGGSSWNAMTGCNTTDASTGATLQNFSQKTIVWDGKNVNGSQNGTTVADGTYKITVESTWNHGASNHIVRSFTFAKGPNSDNQTPTSDANLTNISLTWTPGPTGVVENDKLFPTIQVYPNPASEKLMVNYSKGEEIKLIDELGNIVYSTKLAENSTGIKEIDVTKYAKGIYHVLISNGKGKIAKKILLQ